MRKVLVFLLLSLPFLAIAQDTTKVQTLTFDDITKRSGTWTFPDSGKTWEKVLMHYTLKCDPRTTRDRFDCGEWDYLSYIMLRDSTGRIDSNENLQSNFMIADLDPDTFEITYTTPYNKREYYQYFKVVTSTTSQDSANIGTTTTNLMEFFGSQRAQTIYTAAELSAAGLTAGPITGLNFYSGTGGTYRDVKIRMMATTKVQNGDFIDGAFTTVYHSPLSHKRPGRVVIDFVQPFNWDGTSNIVVDIIPNTRGAVGMINVEAESNTTNQTLVPGTVDQYYNPIDRAFIDIHNADSAFQSLDKEITISFWAKGDDRLPVNTSIIDARNKDNFRMLNIHMPWSNGSIYWDAPNGNRINKAASAAEYKNQWNHWAFVKNGNDGSMKIYKNGALWHSGTDKTTSVKGITRFRIGKGNSYQYFGKIDQLRVWSKEISAAEIMSYMNKPVDLAHPNFNDLIIDFDFETTGTLDNEIISNHTGVKGYELGEISTVSYAKEDRFRNAGRLNMRPKITFKKAVEVSHIDSVIAVDDVKTRKRIVTLFQDPDSVTKITGYDFGYDAGTYYTIDPQGNKKDSTVYTPDTRYVKALKPYYTKFEVINNIEIGRFITPYGIGLDLGPEGFEWIYDVTDYASLFQGDVTLTAGNQQELIDLRFDMISGTPPRDVKKIHYLSNRESRRYVDITNDVHFSADTLDLLPESETYRLTTRITGHGHNGNSGGGQIHCCEWANKNHHLDINGKREISWDIWMNDKCALNPVFDQGGNWAPPRAGWCPSAPVDDYNFELTDIIGSDNQVVIDYDIDDVPVDNPGQGNGNYVVSMHLFEYGKPNFANDAAVLEIMHPNSRDFYRKTNPTCRTPQIRIRNNGSETLTEVLITYGVVGGHKVQFLWTGSLGFLETEDVELTFNAWDWATNDPRHLFFAEVSAPNGKDDEYVHNNRYEVGFTQPEVLPTQVEFFFRNNDIADADLTITNDAGQVVHSVIDGPAKTLFRDTITFNPGCYKMEVVTAEGFGLTYPLIPQIGTGMLLMRQLGGGGYRSQFNLDFGKSLTYYFTVGYTLENEQIDITRSIGTYPNPTTDEVVLDLQGYLGHKLNVQIMDIQGKMLVSENVNVLSDNEILEYHLGNQKQGIYYLNVQGEGVNFAKKIVKM